MLGRINASQGLCEMPPMVEKSREYNRFERNEMEDMKKGIEYLYEFKEKLSKLHPSVLDAIEKMLQCNNRY